MQEELALSAVGGSSPDRRVDQAVSEAQPAARRGAGTVLGSGTSGISGTECKDEVRLDFFSPFMSLCGRAVGLLVQSVGGNYTDVH